MPDLRTCRSEQNWGAVDDADRTIPDEGQDDLTSTPRKPLGHQPLVTGRRRIHGALGDHRQRGRFPATAARQHRQQTRCESNTRDQSTYALDRARRTRLRRVGGDQGLVPNGLVPPGGPDRAEHIHPMDCRPVGQRQADEATPRAFTPTLTGIITGP